MTRIDKTPPGKSPSGTTPSRRPASSRPARPRPEAAAERPSPIALVAVRTLFRAETREYFLLLGTAIFLLVFGLVMVLSSSSIESRLGDGDFFARAARQGLYAAIGLPLMLVAARAPIAFWKRWAGVALVLGVALQLLVFTDLGIEIGGNRGWVDFGAFTVQPSELIKLALVLWLPWLLIKRTADFDDWRRLIVPAGPVVAVAIGLVLAGRDLGSTSIMILAVLGVAFFAGIRMRHLGFLLAVIAVIVSFVATLTMSRRNRIDAWLSGCVDPALLRGECWQTVHGWEALAHGGLTGVGLGNSAGKWSWIPAADNDFIFAIIGEELGLVGCLLVLGLFVMLTYCLMRIIKLVRDPYAKVVTAGVMVWITGQALVNIAVVLGVLPVLGVPLPLVSSGGSALLTTMTAIGVVLSFARKRAGA